MQYLPYLEEKSWDEQILTPTQQIWMGRIEWLPLYSAAYNMMIWNNKHTEDLPAFARYFIWVPSAFGGMLVDGVWQIWNAALNGYKRAYNNGAAMYNNAAAQIENWLTPTVAPQTSLTWRKIMPGITFSEFDTYMGNSPEYYERYGRLNPSQKQQLFNTFLKSVAKNNNFVPDSSINATVVNTIPAWATTEQATQVVTNNNATLWRTNDEIKSTIVKWLTSIVNKWKVAGNIDKIQKLINLYNKVK